MPSLLELQRAFAAGILARNAQGMVERISGDSRQRSARFDVYSNNFYVSLMDALSDVYPVIDRLIGGACFRQVARRYVAAHPSQSGDLHRFGDKFAAHLTDTPELATLPYLPDVARLEWTYHRAFHSPDAAPELVPGLLAGLDEAELALLRIDLHPSAFLLTSAYPVLRIWQANLVDTDDVQEISLDEGGVRLLVQRPALDVELLTLGAGEFEFLLSLSHGRTLLGAFEHAIGVDSAFDLRAALTRFHRSGTLLRWRNGSSHPPLSASHGVVS